MRRIFYVIPVAALGAGGLYWWHRTDRVSPPPAKQGLLMRDGRTYVPPSPASPLGSISPAGSAVSASAGALPVQPTSPSSAAVPSTSVAGVSSTGPVVIAPAAGDTANQPTPALTQREQFEIKNSLAGDQRKLAVPLPGVEKTQKKLGTMAKCQGPQAEQHYATLTGKERSDFARFCARYGITLAP